MPKSFKSFREEVEQIGEGVFSKFNKARTQKKKDAKYDKKNTAYKKRSDARTNRSTELDLSVGDRVAKGDRTSLKNPSRAAHNKRAVDTSTRRYKNGNNLPRLPEEVEQVDEGSAAKYTKDEKFLIKQLAKEIRDFDPYDDENDDHNGWGETPREAYEEALDEIEKIAGKKVRDQLETDYKPRLRNKVKSDPKRSSQKSLRDYGTKNTKKVRASDAAKKKFKKAIKDRLGSHKKAMMGKLPESVEQVDEALSHAQRIKASLRMKKMKARIKIGRDRAMRKAPNMDVVKKRAMKKARTLLLKKMTKGAGKDEMSFARRAEIEKRLSKKQAVIQRLAKKMIPDVRKADRERRANKGK